MTGSRRVRWFVVLASSIVLAGALALPAGADPPQDVRPGSGGSPATEIALCCTWGDGIKDGITYSVDAPDAATADAVAAGVEEWQSDIGDPALQFDRVNSDAEVTIRVKRGGGTTAGSTKLIGSGGFIAGASMSISAKAFGTTNTAAQLTTVTEHEWGHVLGLLHANGTGLLMSPVLDPAVTTIQKCDLNAVKSTKAGNLGSLSWFIANADGTPTAPSNSSYVC
jgi:hypothetical protein